MSDLEKLVSEYNLGVTTECPYCSNTDLEHSCRNCYSDIDKETCWEFKGLCKKCFIYIKEEIPRIVALKKELGVSCKCNEPNCGKCLFINCKDDDCPVHTREKKNRLRRIKNGNP